LKKGENRFLLRQESKTWTPYLKENGITVVHVVSSTLFALKAQNAGVDAIVAEGLKLEVIIGMKRQLSP
jgi:NAD(P)H-dependent flavin oxidoreductase YrpB (nitropropane dioxygenase family)